MVKYEVGYLQSYMKNNNFSQINFKKAIIYNHRSCQSVQFISPEVFLHYCESS